LYRYIQGSVEAVEPDFGGDAGGGVRLAVTIAPWPEDRRMKALMLAAAAAAKYAVAAEAEKMLEARGGGGVYGDYGGAVQV
jgi:hypothetical protein